ncbi:MAG: c-type cytochrome [Holosporales bacterium]
MDFPVFHLDLMGGRGLIAVIATLHVLINHGLAVGLMPLIALMEWHGNKTKDKRWDTLAYKILFFAFLITTTVGALTGVGIWLSVSLVNPYAIGSLIRVFFWAWFTEWLVFITEVVLIVVYFLTWKKAKTPEQKKRHIRFGFALAFFSWVTMAIIVAILGFMMNPGNWLSDRTLWSGFMNPLYLPQMALRTPLAMAMAGVIAMVLTSFFTRKDEPLRGEALRAIGVWTAFWTPLMLLGGYWYYTAVPASMVDNLATGLLTMQFTEWHEQLLHIVLGTVLVLFVVVQLAIFRPQKLPKIALIVPLLAIIWLTGHYERVREFIRKPYVIGQYMYANRMRVDDYPLFHKDGVLKHSTYSTPLSAAEKQGAKPEDFIVLQQGKDVFMNTCSSCHTGNGVNKVTGHITRMFGDKPVDPKMLGEFFETMHNAQAFMPPFPGNKAEAEALAKYLLLLRDNKAPIAGAQDVGVTLNPADVLAPKNAAEKVKP